MPDVKCSRCLRVFPVLADEGLIYSKLGLPRPAKCPDCREQVRLSFRNERKLYPRTCSQCGRRIISNFSPDTDYRIMCPSCWYSDAWDPRQAGADFDFGRSFFEQFGDLTRRGTFLSLFTRNNQNSDYINHETDDKNCFCNFGGHYNEDCYYNTYSIWGKDNVDCYWVIRCELCYECVDCERCYDSTYLQDCTGCSASHFCRDCIACKNCFGCFGLRHKEHYFFNEPLSAEVYSKRLSELWASGLTSETLRGEVQRHFLTFPHKAVRHIRAEDSLGDRLTNCRRSREAFSADEAEDCQYLYVTAQTKDCADLTSTGWAELAYQVSSSIELNTVVVAAVAMNLQNCLYTYMCVNSTDLFGCVGMNHNQYCILNK